MDVMKKLIKQIIGSPILHFFILGALVFWIYDRVSEGRNDNYTIHITEAYIKRLADNFQQKNLRPPSPLEMESLIEQEVEQEVLYREAVKRQLSQGDEFIRKRMIKKMRFIIEGMTKVPQPSTEQLQAYLDLHPKRFTRGEQISFHHIFFNRSKRGSMTHQDAAAVLAKLKKESMPLEETYQLGDPFLRRYQFTLVDEKQVQNIFGAGFAKQLKTLKPSSHWQGSITSRYGEHLVYLQKRLGEQIPPLNEIYTEVYQAWKDTQKIEAERVARNNLKKNYKVIIDKPQITGGLAPN